jgi:hypothetical protein
MVREPEYAKSFDATDMHPLLQPSRSLSTSRKQKVAKMGKLRLLSKRNISRSQWTCRETAKIICKDYTRRLRVSGRVLPV